MDDRRRNSSMRNEVNFPILPDLSVIDFTCVSDVCDLAQERRRYLFGPRSDGFIDEYMEAIDDLFAGRHPQYQAIDTDYHDIRHTLQATLCLTELLMNRQLTGVVPRISADDFRRALIAVLFHDIGYLKKTGDSEGSGAKYTHLHEQRSCDFMREFLSERSWPEDDLQCIENLISATGPSADVTQIGFRSEIERVLGQTVCTADYIGQMSDPHYPDKLEILFNEFRESYQYQQLPPSEWPFASYEALLRGTPGFWGTFVQHKLTVQCANIWQHLKHPFTGENPYMESIERNLATIDQRIADLEP